MKILVLERVQGRLSTIVAVGTSRKALTERGVELARSNGLPRSAVYQTHADGSYVTRGFSLLHWRVCPVDWCGPDPLQRVDDMLSDALTVVRLDPAYQSRRGRHEA